MENSSRFRGLNSALVHKARMKKTKRRTPPFKRDVFATLKRRGYTQFEVAYVLKVPLSTLWGWLSGRSAAPANLQKRIEDAFLLPRGALTTGAVLSAPPPYQHDVVFILACRGYTRANLAYALEVSQTTLKNWLTGYRSAPLNFERCLEQTILLPQGCLPRRPEATE